MQLGYITVTKTKNQEIFLVYRSLKNKQTKNNTQLRIAEMMILRNPEAAQGCDFLCRFSLKNAVQMVLRIWTLSCCGLHWSWYGRDYIT